MAESLEESSSSSQAEDLKAYEDLIAYMQSDDVEQMLNVKFDDVVDLVRAGDEKELLNRQIAFSNLAANIPEVYDGPAACKKTYAYLRTFADYMNRALAEYEAAAGFMHDGKEDKALDAMSVAEEDLDSAVEAANGLNESYEQVAAEYRSVVS